jgi:hypothetical protein
MRQIQRSDIKALIAALEAITGNIAPLYLSNSETLTPELKTALEELWEACEDYQAAFESFSHQ